MAKKILITGGSGFVAAHILDLLLAKRYNVVTTIRSKAKGDAILAAHPGLQTELQYEIVPDIAQDGAFDEVFRKHRDIEAVIHAASPFHDSFDSPMELLDPAIKGTTGILKAIRQTAPTVKRVVLTSSFASMVNEKKAPAVYDESCWNPISWEDATTRRDQAYRGSKTFAEKAAWEFMASKPKPAFDLVVICPPMVYGPIVHQVNGVANVNTSNQRILSLIQGNHRDGGRALPPTGTLMWVDVRDLAEAHVKAVEVPEAGGQRFFAAGGHYSNKTLVDAIRETHPELSQQLPTNVVDELVGKAYTFDNSRIRRVLGMEFRSLQDGAGATVNSLLKL